MLRQWSCAGTCYYRAVSVTGRNAFQAHQALHRHAGANERSALSRIARWEVCFSHETPDTAICCNQLTRSTRMTRSIPHFELARITDDGVDQVRIVRVAEIPWETETGRRGFVGTAMTVSAALGAMLSGCAREEVPPRCFRLPLLPAADGGVAGSVCSSLGRRVCGCVGRCSCPRLA